MDNGLGLVQLPLSPFDIRQDAENKWSINRSNTLRDVTREYLRGTVTWLLNYEANIPLAEQLNDRPLRTQETGNPWITALSCCYLADALPIIKEIDSNLSEEIARKLLSPRLGDQSLGVIQWLLEPRKPGWPIRADSLVYDVSTTLLALLKTQYLRKQNKRHYQDSAEIWKVVTKLSQWLEDMLEDESWVIHDLNTSGGLHIGRTLETVAYFNNYFPARFRSCFMREDVVFKKVTELILRYLDARLESKSDSVGSLLMESMSRELFYGLSYLIQGAKKDFLDWMGLYKETHVVINMLEKYVKWYEDSITVKLAGGFASGARNLAIYIWLDDVLNLRGSSRASDNRSEIIIWTSFRRLIDKGNLYSNGSVFDNSLLETVWFAGLLLTLYNWSRSEKKVIVFLDQVLFNATDFSIIEREQTFLLREQITLLNNQKRILADIVASEKKKNDRIRLMYMISSMIVLASYIIAFLLPGLKATTPVINPTFQVTDLQSTLALIAILVPGAVALAIFFHASSHND